MPSFLGRFSRHWQRAPLHRHHPRQLSARLRYPRWRGGARDRLGKNRGIGAATARVLGQADARVMLADISGRQVEQTAATLAGEGYDIAWQTIDLSDESTAKALLNAMVARFGRLDILDNNAASQGPTEDRLIADMSVDGI
ncbi:MAG TPA: SDR family NAD(P)-dependent oxidoreductase [Rhizorhapis sp.]